MGSTCGYRFPMEGVQTPDRWGYGFPMRGYRLPSVGSTQSRGKRHRPQGYPQGYRFPLTLRREPQSSRALSAPLMLHQQVLPFRFGPTAESPFSRFDQRDTRGGSTDAERESIEMRVALRPEQLEVSDDRAQFASQLLVVSEPGKYDIQDRYGAACCFRCSTIMSATCSRKRCRSNPVKRKA